MKRSAMCLFLILATLSAAAQSRPATQADKAFVSKVLGACAKAIPPGPSGWEATLKPETAPPDSISAIEGEPLPLSLAAAWTNPKASKTEPEKDPKEDALLVKQAELASALAQAGKKGDTAAEDRLQKELDDIETQLDKIESSREAAGPAAKAPATAQDSSLKITIEINPRVIPLPKGAKAASPVAGCKAYTLGEGNSGQPGGTLVLLGQWTEAKDEGSPRLESPKAPGAKVLSVQTLAVRVEASPSRAKQVVEKMDWAGLKGLLAK